jgi:hypothetical protein
VRFATVERRAKRLFAVLEEAICSYTGDRVVGDESHERIEHLKGNKSK